MLKNHLVDILYSYALSARYFNGEWDTDYQEAATHIINLSNVLNNNSIFETVEMAIESSIQTALKPPHSYQLGQLIGVLSDVMAILHHKHYVLLALSDIHSVLQHAKDSITTKTQHNKKGINKLETIQKKIYFFMAWANDQQEMLFTLLSHEVEMEWEKLKDQYKENKQKPKQMAAPSQQHPLVEELKTKTATTSK